MDLLSIIAPAITNLAFFPCMYLVARYAMYVQRKTYSEREAELWIKIHTQETMIQGLVYQRAAHAEAIEQLRRDLSMLRTRQDLHERAVQPQAAPQLTPTPKPEPAEQAAQPKPEDARWAMIEMD